MCNGMKARESSEMYVLTLALGWKPEDQKALSTQREILLKYEQTNKKEPFKERKLNVTK